MEDKLLLKLEKRRREGTLRSLSHLEGYVDFYSNDYLGYGQQRRATMISGGGGSRLISGTTNQILLAEQEIASFFSAERGVMFNSGYDANLGFFSSVPQRGEVVIFDEFIHASVRDGIRLGFAESRSFKHNNMDDLRAKLKASGAKHMYVVVESLYSMEGDFAPLKEVAEICKKFDARLIVDEAHACGIFGPNGTGRTMELGLVKDVFARIVTFGKSYGSHGGIVLGSVLLIDYLINFARSFIYTTALPEEVYIHNAKVIQADDREERVKMLNANLNEFNKAELVHKRISERDSPIQVIEIGRIDETKKLASLLQQNNFAVKPIYSPTVPKGKERIRICLHEFNNIQEIHRLVETINQ